MPIEFLDLLDADDDGAWRPWPPDDAAHVDGPAWHATRIDPSFDLTGVRLATGVTVQRHHHNRSLLVLVFAGELTVSWSDEDSDSDSEQHAGLRAGQFCVIDADTEHRLTAGTDGATYLTSWPLEAPELITTWEDA